MPRSGLLVQSLLWTISSSAILQASVDASGHVAGSLIRREHGNASRHVPYDLLVLIPAHGQRDLERMRAVRETWVRDIDASHRCPRCRSRRTVKYLFLLGEEAQDMEDVPADTVVLPRCSSAYELLAQKVKRGIRYATRRYDFALLLKADTDSWIFLDRLLSFAEEHQLFDPRRSVQAGELRRKGHPQSAGRNPDAVFTKLTGQETYPLYSPGCGYLLTRSLCNYIAMMAGEEGAGDQVLPGLQDLPQEDVSVGFWLEAVEHEHLSMPLSITGDACSSSQGPSLVLDHYVSKEEMHRRWENIQQTGDPCEEA